MGGSDTPGASQPDETNESPNTLRHQCSTRLQGRRVIVESAEGTRFEGLLERLDLEHRNVLLKDARELPAGTHYPQAFVAGVDWIVLSDHPE